MKLYQWLLHKIFGCKLISENLYVLDETGFSVETTVHCFQCKKIDRVFTTQIPDFDVFWYEANLEDYIW